jgi:hypothetical protein
MAASNTRFTQNSLGQSKNPIDSDHGIYRDHSRALGPDDPTRDPQQLANPQKKIANQSIVNLRPLEIYRMTGLGHLLDLCVRHHWSERLR